MTTRSRILLALVACMLLAGLLMWQDYRLRLVNACLSRGGMWDGWRSECRSPPLRIFIEKDLKRS